MPCGGTPHMVSARYSLLVLQEYTLISFKKDSDYFNPILDSTTVATGILQLVMTKTFIIISECSLLTVFYFSNTILISKTV